MRAICVAQVGRPLGDMQGREPSVMGRPVTATGQLLSRPPETTGATRAPRPSSSCISERADDRADRSAAKSQPFPAPVGSAGKKTAQLASRPARLASRFPPMLGWDRVHPVRGDRFGVINARSPSPAIPALGLPESIADRPSAGIYCSRPGPLCAG